MNTIGITPQAIWSDLLEYLGTTKDETGGLTALKIMERGRLLESESTPSRLVFVVERHNAIAGARYRKGQPMTSYETRLDKHAYDPISWSISMIESCVVGRKLDPLSEVYEWDDNCTIWVEFDEESASYQITDSENSIKFTVSNLKDAENEMRDAIDALGWGIELAPYVEEGPTLESMILEMKAYACECAIEKLRAAWETCDDERN